MAKTTHPIQVEVRHTVDAVNVFDRICYEKGACFIKQMSYFVGEDILKLGMKEYFTKYALKNTILPDFVGCLQNAAKTLGKDEVNIQEWTDSWLTKAGANEIEADVSQIGEDGSGTIKIQ